MNLKSKPVSGISAKPGLRPAMEDESSYGSKAGTDLFARLIWGLLIGIAVVLVIVLYVLGITRWSHSNRVEDPAPVAAAPGNTGSPVVGQGLQPEQTADKFLNAATPQDRLYWVRRPNSVADLMERFYRDGPGATEKVADVKKMTPGGADDQAFERFAVTMTDGSRRLLCVPFDGSGSALGVDFKSYARHCSVPWSAVLDGTAPKADEMRVFLQRGNYYNYEFADEGEWLCLIATSPELENPIRLYARRNNPDLLLFLQNPPQQPQRYTIALENTGRSHLNRQWQLTRVLTMGWVEP